MVNQKQWIHDPPNGLIASYELFIKLLYPEPRSQAISNGIQ